jgi:hypothetical protein
MEFSRELQTDNDTRNSSAAYRAETTVTQELKGLAKPPMRWAIITDPFVKRRLIFSSADTIQMEADQHSKATIAATPYTTAPRRRTTPAVHCRQALCYLLQHGHKAFGSR